MTIKPGNLLSLTDLTICTMKNFVFIFLFFSTHGLAQDSTNKNSGIITRKTFGSFKMDGKRIVESDVKTEIYRVPAAIPFIKRRRPVK